MPTREEIKAARDLLKETQAVFAKRFGVDQATVHRWETMGLPEHGTAQVAVENLLAELGRPNAGGRMTRLQRLSMTSKKAARVRRRLGQLNPTRRSQRRKPTVSKQSQKTEPDESVASTTDPNA